MDIVNQLGQLFLQAVPTVIIVFFFYLFMRWSFFQPMQRVLTERHKRAEGSLRDAEAIRARAQEKLRSYNESLRNARAQIFAEQEAQRRVALDERQAMINKARSETLESLEESKKAISADAAAARADLERSAEALAQDIAEMILAGRLSGEVSLEDRGAT